VPVLFLLRTFSGEILSLLKLGLVVGIVLMVLGIDAVALFQCLIGDRLACGSLV
jgi:hypothetical protein